MLYLYACLFITCMLAITMIDVAILPVLWHIMNGAPYVAIYAPYGEAPLEVVLILVLNVMCMIPAAIFSIVLWRRHYVNR